MTNLFNLQNIAIIGASSNRKKLGYQITKNLIDGGFKGKIFPINLDDKEILGLPAYQTILDVYPKIDMAVIVIPKEGVLTVLKQCVHKEIPYVIIITSGFAEKDEAGKKLQAELAKVIFRTKTKIIGPNCLGIMNTAENINLNFAATNVKMGPISLILQSGSIGAAIFDWAKENNIGINKFISLGNKMSILENDVLEILENDDDTKIIGLYLEEISDPEKFLILSRRISGKKPIVILKGGMTKEGASAASSHTAALMSEEYLNLMLFEQANVIYADDLEEFLNILEIFASREVNLSHGSLAIIGNAGGPSILAADAASKNHLTLEKLSPKEVNLLKKDLPEIPAPNNPFDLGGDATAEDYQKMIRFLGRIDKYSSILAIVTPQTATEIEKTAEVITDTKTLGKIVVASFLGGDKVKPALKILRTANIPHLEDPSLGIKLLAKIYHYFWSKTQTQNYLSLGFTKPKFSPQNEAELIRDYQLPYIESYSVDNKEELSGFAKKLGYPLVYKSSSAVHRGKENKVALNITNFEILNKKTQEIGFPGILQKMVDSPYEVIVGAKRDDSFGIVLTFGYGGILAEEENDVSFKMLPLTDADLNNMIEKTKIWPVIEDLRVKQQLKDLLSKTAILMRENPDIREFELNPIKVFYGRIVAVDINIKRGKDE